ncbi:MAG TPA: ANTAR domain-containing protein, partial [Streptosporangiaceae bacterium]|nr:ANTAR domain-containing protein [Streptosporangiaceae bacterium]
AAAALLAGVRCSLSFAYQAHPRALSLTLFGARPRSIDPRRAQPAEMLGALGGAVLGAVSVYDDARRTATQLRDAAASRAVVDQAKGILMHARGCTADEALEHMRQTSQRRNVRAIDVAKEIVESGGRPEAARGRNRRSAKSGS